MIRRHSPRKRGSLLLDATMATALLGVVMVVTMQVIDRIASQRRAADRRQFATQCVANTLEQLSLRTWDELAPGPIAVPPLDTSTQSVLPGARLSARSTNNASALALRRIAIELSWSDQSGAPPNVVRLVTWIARAGRSQP
jgi:hypothetical protein